MGGTFGQHTKTERMGQRGRKRRETERGRQTQGGREGPSCGTCDRSSIAVRLSLVAYYRSTIELNSFAHKDTRFDICLRFERQLHMCLLQLISLLHDTTVDV